VKFTRHQQTCVAGASLFCCGFEMILYRFFLCFHVYFSHGCRCHECVGARMLARLNWFVLFKTDVDKNG
jgi:hypothetical protein